jgi:hypothetical protein
MYKTVGLARPSVQCVYQATQEPETEADYKVATNVAHCTHLHLYAPIGLYDVVLGHKDNYAFSLCG